MVYTPEYRRIASLRDIGGLRRRFDEVSRGQCCWPRLRRQGVIAERCAWVKSKKPRTSPGVFLEIDITSRKRHVSSSRACGRRFKSVLKPISPEPMTRRTCLSVYYIILVDGERDASTHAYMRPLWPQSARVSK